MKKLSDYSKKIQEQVARIIMSPSPRVITYSEYLSEPKQGVLCRECGTILVSYSTHDYKTCSCKNETMVDGGPDYIRYGGVDLDKVLVVTVSISKDEQKLHEKKYKPKLPEKGALKRLRKLFKEQRKARLAKGKKNKQ